MGGEWELLADLGRFPLLEAIFGRRSRRFGLGMRIPSGPLAYTSRHAPLPLSDLERALLVLCGAGISGWTFGIEHTASAAPEHGCNYPIRLTGRTYASRAGVLSSELAFTDDSGSYITRLRDLDARGLRELRDAADLPALLGWLEQHVVRLSDRRASVPAGAPHVSSHNLWNANQPGTTLFMPVIDLTQPTLNTLFIRMGEGIVPYDPFAGRPCGDLEPLMRRGVLDARRRMSLIDFEQSILAGAAMEMAIACHNISLALQAMGLGGWTYTGINPLSLMGAYAADGVPGLGFRFARDERWTQPNPVGLDGVFEGFCPPYHADMRAAVAAFVAQKFGPGGTYDPARPGPYRDSARVKAAVARYRPEVIAAVAEVATYIYATYGKFPATIPSMYMFGYTQAHHLDLDFYDAYFGPDAYLETHRQHLARWHGR
jgi:hypothetical protein